MVDVVVVVEGGVGGGRVMEMPMPVMGAASR